MKTILEGVQNIRLVIFDIDGTLTQYHTMDKIVKDTLARFSCVSKKEYKIKCLLLLKKRAL